MTTADRTLFWFSRTYGLDFADAERMAAYEAKTDAGHATRVSILMNCDKLSFDAAVSIVAQTDAEFDREELAETTDATSIELRAAGMRRAEEHEAGWYVLTSAGRVWATDDFMTAKWGR